MTAKGCGWLIGNYLASKKALYHSQARLVPRVDCDPCIHKSHPLHAPYIKYTRSISGHVSWIYSLMFSGHHGHSHCHNGWHLHPLSLCSGQPSTKYQSRPDSARYHFFSICSLAVLVVVMCHIIMVYMALLDKAVTRQANGIFRWCNFVVVVVFDCWCVK